MIDWELIICWTDGSWITDHVEHEDHILEEDVHKSYLEEFCRKMTKDDTRDIAYLGTYCTEQDPELEEIEG